MELKMEKYNLPESPRFNYDQLKAEIIARTSEYKTLVYTEDQIKEAKADRANLNKVSKALTDERIRLEKEYMAPFSQFKNQVAEIVGYIKDASAEIDVQVKAYEDKQKEEKREKILAYKAEAEKQHTDELVGISVAFNDRWLNASVSMKSIEDEINTAIEKVITDLATLSNLPEFGFEAVEVYKTTLDINKAISEAQRMSAIAKAKEAEMARRKEEEARRAEEEAKRRAEAEAEMLRRAEAEAVEQSKAVDESPAQTVPEAQWISFRAYLTTQDALALRDFFNNNNIIYEPIRG